MTRVLELGEFQRVAFFGGVYSNHLALAKAIEMAKAAKVDAMIALGDFGAFGPHPDRTVEIVRALAIPAIQGNYEESLAAGAEDCHCGYTDPRDNHFAALSYGYTAAKTAPEHKRWMAELPQHARLTIGGKRLLACHGSPRQINEFLWRSTTPEAFTKRLLREHDADTIVCTHTGIHWSRWTAPGQGIVNTGALGRPANDGRTNVWFTLLEADGAGLQETFVPVDYDHAALAREMRSEGLPNEFIETIETGWWTTCLEILPAKERGAGRY